MTPLMVLSSMDLSAMMKKLRQVMKLHETFTWLDKLRKKRIKLRKPSALSFMDRTRSGSGERLSLMIWTTNRRSISSVVRSAYRMNFSRRKKRTA